MNSKKNKFSIICSVYNTKEIYFNRLLLSLKKQNYNNYEFILINNGSTKNIDYFFISKQILKNEIKHKLINKNLGFGEGRNIGVSMATGDYIIFVDSDDELKENSLKKITNICNNNASCDVFLFGFDLIKIIDNKKMECNICKNNNDKKDIIINTKDKNQIKHFNRINLYSAGWSKIIKLSFIKNNNIKFFFDKENLIEDLYYHLNILFLAEKIYVVNSFKYYIYYLSNFSTINDMMSSNNYSLNYLNNIKLSLNFCEKNKKLNFKILKIVIKKINKVFFNINWYCNFDFNTFIAFIKKYKNIIDFIYQQNNKFVPFLFYIIILFFFVCSIIKKFPYIFYQFIKKK